MSFPRLARVALLLLCSLPVAVWAAPAVTLSWQDNSNNETGFAVERAIGSGAFIEIATVAANATAYLDQTVAPSTTYNYRVRAFNAGGYSNYSNTATVTTTAGGGNPPNAAPTGASAVTSGMLVNVSNRGLITVGDATMIPGFVIQGGPLKVLIRVIGPTIGAAPYNVPGVCSDPALSLRNAAGVEIANNDNWTGAATSDAAAAVGAFALAVGSKDAAIVVTLPPGNYTVVSIGVGGATGVALAEVYALP